MEIITAATQCVVRDNVYFNLPTKRRVKEREGEEEGKRRTKCKRKFSELFHKIYITLHNAIELYS